MMMDTDVLEEVESMHHMDYDDMLEHVVAGDHELLHLDTLLRETYQEPAED